MLIEGGIKGKLNTGDQIKIDLLASPSPTTVDMLIAEDNEVVITSVHPAKAFLLHSIACLGPLAAKIWEVERAFGKKSGGVICCQWLLQWNGRNGKTSSSLIVFVNRAVPTATIMWVRMRARKHTVEEYG